MIDISDWLDELPMERHMVAAQRALHALGYDYTLAPDGTVTPLDVDSIDREALDDQMVEEYQRMCAEDTYADLVAKGAIVAVGVSETGHTKYEVTDAR